LRATPQIMWASPADITVGTALGAAQLNATANVPGALVYTPPAGTALAVGAAQTLSVVFTPTDTTNYTTASASVSINVVAAANVLRFGPVQSKVTSGGFQLRFTALNGQSYDIEASENLTTWSKLGSVIGAGGIGSYTDAGSTQIRHRYYRVRLGSGGGQ